MFSLAEKPRTVVMIDPIARADRPSILGPICMGFPPFFPRLSYLARRLECKLRGHRFRRTGLTSLHCARCECWWCVCGGYFVERESGDEC